MKNLYKALANFQQECPIIHKDTQGYGYTYADLPQIFGVINPLLKKHNLGFTQLINNQTIKTIIFHVDSEEKFESEIAIPQNVELKGMNDFQVLGSAITYLRRYALSSALGLVTDKDTDASGEQTKKQPTKTEIDLPWLNKDTDTFAKCRTAISSGQYTIADIRKKYKISKEVETLLTQN